MPLEVIEENQHAAQVRLTCDNCGAYIGTRIILISELYDKTKTSHLCIDCKQKTGSQSLP